MKKKIIISFAVIVAFLAFGCFSYFRTDGTKEFMAEYEKYDASSREYEIMAHLPGGNDSVTRKNLNITLSKVLTENLSKEERVELSKAGLVIASELLKEVDAIGEGKKTTDVSISSLEVAVSNISGIKSRKKANEIMTLVKNRMDTISTIEDTLRDTNKSIVAIFSGIVTDNGSLTNARISALNEDIPAAEKRFEALTEMYRNLDAVEKKLDTIVVAMENKKIEK